MVDQIIKFNVSSTSNQEYSIVIFYRKWYLICELDMEAS